MTYSGKLSTQAKKLFKQATVDSEHLIRMGSAAKSEGVMALYLDVNPNDVDLWRLADELEYWTNVHSRAGFVALLNEGSYPINLVVSWRAVCMAMLLRERDCMAVAQELGSPEAVFGKVSVKRHEGEITTFAIALWMLYCVGESTWLHDLSPILELFEVRKDILERKEIHGADFSSKEQLPYDIVICLTLLIARGRGDKEAVANMLGDLEPFRDIREIWEDDRRFESLCTEQAQWYMTYCPKHYGKFGEFANVAADVLMPAWLIALDIFRQRSLGRESCLGPHELFVLSRQFLEAARNQRNPAPKAYESVRAFYLSRFGEESFNPVPFWTAFLGEKAGRSR